MVNRILLALILGFGNLTNAQETYIRPGLLSASLTYSPTMMLNHAESNFYLNGFAEYHMDSKFSFRSDFYVFLNSQNDQPILKDGFRSYVGIAYHRTKGNWDSSFGFQPGVTLFNTNETVSKSQVQPSAALRIGTSYYVWKYFHFFANVTYTKSKLMVFQRGTLPTDELIFSAGLGFQIQTKK